MSETELHHIRTIILTKVQRWAEVHLNPQTLRDVTFAYETWPQWAAETLVAKAYVEFTAKHVDESEWSEYEDEPSYLFTGSRWLCWLLKPFLRSERRKTTIHRTIYNVCPHVWPFKSRENETECYEWLGAVDKILCPRCNGTGMLSAEGDSPATSRSSA